MNSAPIVNDFKLSARVNRQQLLVMLRQFSIFKTSRVRERWSIDRINRILLRRYI